MSEILRFENKEYEVDKLNHKAKEICRKIYFVRNEVSELKNRQALFLKAKNSYIEDLKQEIVFEKSGVNLGGLLDED